MPADERATLTLDDLHGAIRRAVCLGMDCHHTETWSQCAEIADKAMPHAEQALKEADRRAREDAAKALRLYGQHALSCPAAPGSLQPLDVCQCGLDAAIRASITTDEG